MRSGGGEFAKIQNRISQICESAEVSLDSDITRRLYEAAGNLGNRTDANGDTVYYRYDALGRIVGIVYGTDTAQNAGFTYDTGCRREVARVFREKNGHMRTVAENSARSDGL